MTRANLNFIGHDEILYHYHNGDQYPHGLVDYFGVAEFCRINRLWEAADFQDWIRQNYTEAARQITTLGNGMSVDMHVQTDVPAEAEKVEQPCIYYAGTFPTDYSYVFTHTLKPGGKRKDGRRPYRRFNYIYVYNWAKLVFEGAPDRFLRWVEKRRPPREPHILPADQAVKASVERMLTEALPKQNAQ